VEEMVADMLANVDVEQAGISRRLYHAHFYAA
jgi:hypothetical protein